MKTEYRNKEKEEGEKIFIGCLIAGFILVACAVIQGLMEGGL